MNTVPAQSIGHAWHSLEAGEVGRLLATDPVNGLMPAVAAERLARHGANLLPEPVRRGPLGMFFGQFADFMIGVLVAAAVFLGVEVEKWAMWRGWLYRSALRAQ